MKNFLIISFDQRFRLAEQGNMPDHAFAMSQVKAWQLYARIEDFADDFKEATDIAVKVNSKSPHLEVLIFEVGHHNVGERSAAACGVRTGIDGNLEWFTDSPHKYANPQ